VLGLGVNFKCKLQCERRCHCERGCKYICKYKCMRKSSRFMQKKNTELGAGSVRGFLVLRRFWHLRAVCHAPARRAKD